eukprot:5527145-Prymnesium_polylepis.8
MPVFPWAIRSTICERIQAGSVGVGDVSELCIASRERCGSGLLTVGTKYTHIIDKVPVRDARFG